MSSIKLTNLTICIILILEKVIIFILKKRVIKMITKQTLFKILAIASLTFITSGTVFADSNNDKSIFPLNGQFSQNIHSKIERNLSSTNPIGIAGLNSFEQKKFNDYGIEVEKKFSSIVQNIDVIFEKTSAGINITVKKTSGGLILLKYMDQENLDKANLNKGTVRDNI
jgi:hypothetical protein